MSAFYISGESLLFNNMSRVMPLVAASGSCRAAGKHGFTLVGALFVIPFILAYTQCPITYSAER